MNAVIGNAAVLDRLETLLMIINEWIEHLSQTDDGS